MFNSVVGVFSPFPEIAHDAQSLSLQSWCLYNTYVECHRGSKAGSGRFESAIDYIFNDTG